ncbi:MAG TPA: hypothetical protein VMU95_26975 [Trebonia sp.]|nr:hypothetical protein [Trebonia sp.]
MAGTRRGLTDTATTILASTHRATEEYLRERNAPSVLLRNSWYLENYTSQLALVLRNGAVIGAAGQGRISAASRADYAEAAAAVLTTEGHTGAVYELGGDLGMSRDELFTSSGDLRRLIGRPTTSLADAVAGALRAAPVTGD